LDCHSPWWGGWKVRSARPLSWTISTGTSCTMPIFPAPCVCGISRATVRLCVRIKLKLQLVWTKRKRCKPRQVKTTQVNPSSSYNEKEREVEKNRGERRHFRGVNRIKPSQVKYSIHTTVHHIQSSQNHSRA
jgi:hypothetical protein